MFLLLVDKANFQAFKKMTSSFSPKDIGADYIPTEEERRVFAECNEESFWFRCELSFFVNFKKMSLHVFVWVCMCVEGSGRRPSSFLAPLSLIFRDRISH